MKTRLYYLALLLLLNSAPIYSAQDSPIVINWQILQAVEFKSKYLKEVNFEMLFPIFTNQLLKLNGQKVIISGYCVPFDKNNRKIALSATNYASCFFCGKAGPASVMTINLKNPTKYKLDAFKFFSGTLKLNDSNINEFYYILEDAIELNK